MALHPSKMMEKPERQPYIHWTTYYEYRGDVDYRRVLLHKTINPHQNYRCYRFSECRFMVAAHISKHSLFRLKITVGCRLCAYPSIRLSLDGDTLKITGRLSTVHVCKHSLFSRRRHSQDHGRLSGVWCWCVCVCVVCGVLCVHVACVACGLCVYMWCVCVCCCVCGSCVWCVVKLGTHSLALFPALSPSSLFPFLFLSYLSFSLFVFFTANHPISIQRPKR